MSRRLVGVAATLALLGLLAGCGGKENPGPGKTSASAGVVLPGYKVGRPYEINGRRYYPAVDPRYDRTGTASWYGPQFHGRPTANGEVFDKDLISAAHPTLPLPSLVEVTNLENNRSIIVRVNDRGPFVDDRLIDLSQGAARSLGFESKGLAPVRVRFIEMADLHAPAPATVQVVEHRPASSQTSRPEPKVAAQPKAPARVRPEAEVATLPSEPRRPEVVLARAEFPAGPDRHCSIAPHFVQVGAFSDGERVRAATMRLASLETVETEPVFVGEQAAMRVRLGPLRDRPAAEGLLAKVRASGYAEAFLVAQDDSATC
jgi:rare lipoprotein A